MEITKENVKHIALLARLEIEESEIAEYQKHLSSVLSHMHELDNINTDGVEPLFSPVFDLLNEKTIEREDAVETHWGAEEAIFNAPSKKQNQFVVDAVIEEN